MVTQIPTAIGKQHKQENQLEQRSRNRRKLGQVKVERLYDLSPALTQRPEDRILKSAGFLRGFGAADHTQPLWRHSIADHSHLFAR
jgi:hypothetical protein